MKKIARRVKVLRSIFDSDRVVVYHGDCLKVIASMPEASVDTIVTDPPYNIGFMSKTWDSGGIAFDPETWRTALRITKPGAMLLAFGGTRTYHRLACAIEDAGWEIRDCLMWVYGSGFPKSLDVSKAIDKSAGVEREKIASGQPVKRMIPGADQNATGSWIKNNEREYQPGIEIPTTPEAARWQGWGTGLKPSWEPIILARKPLDGTVVECALRHGTGALNVNGCRIGTETVFTTAHKTLGDGIKYGKSKPFAASRPRIGRWPANAVFQHDPRCVRVSEDLYACVPGCPVRMLDGQSGVRASGSRKSGVRKGMGYHGADGDDSPSIEGDFGGASRFFYTPKASTAERVLGCPPGYQNRHPTVKPLDICRWLCRLTKTPTGGVVLDPFSGSGSIVVAALLEGRRAIAIELEEESASITVARVQAALKYGDEMQRLKRYKLRGRKKLRRRQRCKRDE